MKNGNFCCSGVSDYFSCAGCGKFCGRKNIFFARLKNFPQEIENTREIIENMSEIIQNISDIFFAIYTPVDFQLLGR